MADQERTPEFEVPLKNEFAIFKNASGNPDVSTVAQKTLEEALFLQLVEEEIEFLTLKTSMEILRHCSFYLEA